MASSQSRSLESSSEAASFNDFGGQFPLHRIDSSHISTTPDSALSASTHAIDSVQKPSPNKDCQEIQTGHLTENDAEETREFDPAVVRVAHADDLISHLQKWAEELDQRSARLHADIATHERRERAFRMWMQNRRAELETQIEEYRQAQTKADVAARRLAMSAG